MSREAFEAFYMTLDESNRSDLYRTTKPFRGVPVGEYKWVVTRSMYVGWQAAERSKQDEIDQLLAELDNAKWLLTGLECPNVELYGPMEAPSHRCCVWCSEVAELTNID